MIGYKDKLFRLGRTMGGQKMDKSYPTTEIGQPPIPPLMKELLAQQRIVLENIQLLLKEAAHPVWIARNLKEPK